MHAAEIEEIRTRWFTDGGGVRAGERKADVAPVVVALARRVLDALVDSPYPLTPEALADALDVDEVELDDALDHARREFGVRKSKTKPTTYAPPQQRGRTQQIDREEVARDLTEFVNRAESYPVALRDAAAALGHSPGIASEAAKIGDERGLLRYVTQSEAGGGLKSGLYRADANLRPLRDRVYPLLAEAAEPMTAREIADALGDVNAQAVAQVLRRAEDLDRGGDGTIITYRLRADAAAAA